MCSRRGIVAELGGLPDGVRRLLRLATAVPERKGAARQEARPSFLTKVGTAAVAFGIGAMDMVGFIGEAFVAFVKMIGLVDSFGEFEKAARSIRALADYLEKNPEALLRGKGQMGGK